MVRRFVRTIGVSVCSVPSVDSPWLDGCSMRCLITGAGGFLGDYLVRHLLAAGHDVVALEREGGRESAGAENLHADLNDAAAMRSAVANALPDAVYHLAAQSMPGRSWEDPVGTCRTNILGTVHLLEAVRLAAPAARVVVTGSSSEYAPSDRPLHEESAMDPSSPYAVSKLATDQVARLYGERYQLAVMRVRPFFLLGPGKTGDVSSDLARGIVAIEQGRAKALSVGNLAAVRDFLDCRDGVAAFAAVAERGAAGGAYNISSGLGCSVRALLDQFKAAARVAVVEQVDPARLRPLDEPVKIGDNARLRALGWLPKIRLAQSVSDILEYWRCKS